MCVRGCSVHKYVPLASAGQVRACIFGLFLIGCAIQCAGHSLRLVCNYLWVDGLCVILLNDGKCATGLQLNHCRREISRPFIFTWMRMHIYYSANDHT